MGQKWIIYVKRYGLPDSSIEAIRTHPDPERRNPEFSNPWQPVENGGGVWLTIEKVAAQLALRASADTERRWWAAVPFTTQKPAPSYERDGHLPSGSLILKITPCA